MGKTCIMAPLSLIPSYICRSSLNSSYFNKLSSAKALLGSQCNWSTTSRKMSTGFRTEADTFGELKVPNEKYYGAQTTLHHELPDWRKIRENAVACYQSFWSFEESSC